MVQFQYPANSGIILIDITGYHINMSANIPGLYNLVKSAYKSNKPVYMTGLTDTKSGNNITYGPISVSLCTLVNNDNIYITFPNIYGIGDVTAYITPSDIITN